MAGRRAAAPIAWALLAACASAPPENEAAAVPVYTAAQAPCQYEVIRTVRQDGAQPSSQQDYERTQRAVLGRLGAQAGADAVIVPTPVPQGPAGMARRREVGPGGPPPVTYEGQAVRFLEGTCR